MGFGISVINTNNSVIINEEYRNYHLIESGIVSNSGTLPSDSSTSLIFLRPSTFGATIYASAASGSYVKVTSGSIEWVRVAESLAPSTATYGLRVYQSTGNISFDSGRRLFLPVSVHRITQQVSGFGSSTSISQPAAPRVGKKRYCSASSFRLSGLAGAEPKFFRQTGISWDSDTSMVLREGVLVSEQGPFVPDEEWWLPSLIFQFSDI